MPEVVITCPSDCSSVLPAVEFSDCNPEVNASEITEIYVSKGNSAAFADWAVAANWTTRIGAATDDKIIKLVVSGEKNTPEKTQREISNFRKSVTNKTHTVAFTIDESNQVNHDFVRNIECGGTYRVWYKTASGHMFGGNGGVGNGLANMFIDMNLAKGVDGIITYPGTVEWKSKFTEARIVSPI